jgi:myo-inositol-1(or 4)-monophosphatase
MLDQNTLELLQQTAHTAAWQAGQVIKSMVDRPKKIKFKGPRDLVTDTDTAAQLAAVKVIVDRFPDARILAEEDPKAKPGEDGKWKIPDGLLWVIDPLDGTSNYATNLPEFCVSVGVALDGAPIAGAIYDPMRNELFEAAHGLGALVNGRPIPVMEHIPLADALVSLDWSRDPQRRSRAYRDIGLLAPHCRAVRSLGTAALCMTYVGVGRVNLYFNYGLMPWDECAAAAILFEVGGEIQRYDGTPWQFGEPELLAGHPAMLDEVLGHLNNP